MSKTLNVTISDDNETWLKDFNDSLEDKYELKIGVSKIVDVILDTVKVNLSELEQSIMTEKTAELKTKAFQQYIERKLSIDKIVKVELQ